MHYRKRVWNIKNQLRGLKIQINHKSDMIVLRNSEIYSNDKANKRLELKEKSLSKRLKNNNDPILADEIADIKREILRCVDQQLDLLRSWHLILNDLKVLFQTRADLQEKGWQILLRR